MRILDELAKAIRGEPSRVRFTDEKLKGLEQMEEFQRQVSLRGYDPNIAAVCIGSDPKKQQDYLRALDQYPCLPDYQI